MPAVWPSASTSPDDRFEQPLSRGVLKIGEPTRPQEKNNRRHTLLTRPAPSCGAALSRGGTLRIISIRERSLGQGASRRAGVGRVNMGSFSASYCDFAHRNPM